eukprot:Plantae.Rhodophyta-Purpureofilum_apyrenoidigerum.ctg10325.p1 GENE.Plantae.Rhodophyta-Purpureofilum_apyrenoidigerum.ctg10325~~Plantae.Rhodophyta-Purpureofilum_apyrenoidigerum.ctg10325.p1  ORF type:complete len:193 (-),score=28.36 Plantae.Rhodophyta-Purpureofilum_apyrenoidigerum.ctg10325:183-761(-)
MSNMMMGEEHIDAGAHVKHVPSTLDDSENQCINFNKLCDPEKPHFCKVCLTAFTSRSNLRVHVRTVHERQRPFACPKCDTNLGTRSTLKRHMKMVHFNERPFGCPICKKAFMTKSCVRRHLRKMHDLHQQEQQEKKAQPLLRDTDTFEETKFPEIFNTKNVTMEDKMESTASLSQSNITTSSCSDSLVGSNK